MCRAKHRGTTVAFDFRSLYIIRISRDFDNLSQSVIFSVTAGSRFFASTIKFVFISISRSDGRSALPAVRARAAHARPEDRSSVDVNMWRTRGGGVQACAWM